jgi:hypothetical protein
LWRRSDRGPSPEAREHVASMLFGLALHEDNRAAIGRARCHRCSTSSLPPPPPPALYAMCHGSLRFRSLTRAAGTDEALRRMAEERGGVRREMARKTLHAVRDLDEENDNTAEF